MFIRYIRYAFLLIIAISLILIALANRQMVTLNLLPGDLTGYFGFSGSLTLPLFVVILLGIILGLLIGFVWEWMREFKHRRDLSKTKKEVRGLEREVNKLKVQSGEKKDDVLALLD